jgi:hydroxymethylpyrimidine/phosphomethylpyrimidine kinase
MYEFLTIRRINSDYFIIQHGQLVFEIETDYIFFEVGTEFVNMVNPRYNETKGGTGCSLSPMSAMTM